MKKLFKNIILSLVVPILFLIAWSILSKSIDNEIILPPISKVFVNFKHANDNFIGLGSLTGNILVSFIRVIIGYSVGVLLALPLGIIMGYFSIINKLFDNFVNIFRPIPPLAWVPLVLGWFGVGSIATVIGITQGNWFSYLNNFKLSMIFIIALGTFFPVLTNVIFGIRNVKKTLIDSCLVLGANKADIFFKVLLPSAAPTIINGLRVGLGIAWACLVSAEMLPGSLSGVGYLITHAYELARTDLVITGMVCIGLIGALLDYIFRLVERKYFSWENKSN